MSVGNGKPDVVVMTRAAAGVGHTVVSEFGRHRARFGLLARGREGIISWFTLLLLVLGSEALAQEESHQHHDKQAEKKLESSSPHSNHEMGHSGKYPMSASDCSEMQIWDTVMGMCMPLPMAGMPMRMLMLTGNIFGGYTWQEGARGGNAAWSTNMVMLDMGTSLGDRHYLNLDVMGTVERWSVPSTGYPLLLQVGEENARGEPYVDAQHPHSSPIMGLTLSDTIRLGSGRDFLKLFFAPRGASTDGPVPFMHRPTGVMNPDAPLGHHIGQDVGHISSTVIGGALKLASTRIEASAFHGKEPEPAHVDLPIGTPDSIGIRVTQEFTQYFFAMASFAYVNEPEPHDPSVSHVNRYSASAYNRVQLSNDWTLDNALIYGGIANYDNASYLNSFTEEFWLHSDRPSIWGRIEVLERTPAQLQITSTTPNSPRWVTHVTLGYTHIIGRFADVDLALGASVTKDFLPADYAPSYGGNPWSGKVFLQLKGMRMWDL